MSNHIDLTKADLSRVCGVARENLPPTLRRHEAMFVGPMTEPLLDKVLATGRVKVSKIGRTTIINTPSFLKALDDGIEDLSPAKARKPTKRKRPTRAVRKPEAERRAAP